VVILVERDPQVMLGTVRRRYEIAMTREELLERIEGSLDLDVLGLLSWGLLIVGLGTFLGRRDARELKALADDLFGPHQNRRPAAHDAERQQSHPERHPVTQADTR
jgi:hypothetical protein